MGNPASPLFLLFAGWLLIGCVGSQSSTSNAQFGPEDPEFALVTEPPISLLPESYGAADRDPVTTASTGTSEKAEIAPPETDRPTPAEAAASGAGSFRWLVNSSASSTPAEQRDASTPFFAISKGAPIAGLDEMDPIHENVEEEISANAIRPRPWNSLLGREVRGFKLASRDIEVSCLKPELVEILRATERHFDKPVVIYSGYRDTQRNKRVGGARNSMHLHCKAADIQIEGVTKWELAHFLSTQPGRGGIGTYCRTRSVHIDIGPRREWHHPCRELAKN